MTWSFNRTTLQFTRLPDEGLLPGECSPDLNPTENIWGWMAREVYKNGRQFQTVDAFHEAIFTTWSNVLTRPDSWKQLPKQVFDVINNSPFLTLLVLLWVFWGYGLKLLIS